MLKMKRVTVAEGRLRGIECGDRRVTLFRGVPFAKPPVGELRWRAPQPPEPWQGERLCCDFAPGPVQADPCRDPDAFYTKEFHCVNAGEEYSEDCLYLNVWTPAASPDERLPVYVWFYGGAFASGTANDPEFDAMALARQGIVVVTANYRVNIFGFFYHEQLQAEPHSGPCANFGLQDQAEALRWVQRNIASFGGDAGRVTIGGQSAGAGAVMSLMTSPHTEGLFHRAIAQSGGGLRSFGYGHPVDSREATHSFCAALLEKLGAKTVDEARAIPADEVFAAFSSFGKRVNPIADGDFQPDDHSRMMMENRFHRVDFLLGYNTGEGPGTPTGPAVMSGPDDLHAYALKRYGARGEEFFALCGGQSADVASLLCNDVFNTRALSARLYTEAQRRLGRSCWCYRFDAPIPGDDAPGAFHAAELWFTFGSLAGSRRPFTGEHYDISRAVMGYWANFIRTGDPNGADMFGAPLPRWEASTPQAVRRQYIGSAIRPDTAEPDELMRFCMSYYLDM